MNATSSEDTRGQVLRFWFGDLDANGNCSAEFKKRWFTKNPDFDAEILEKFAGTYAIVATSRAHRPQWMRGPEGLLAAVIVLDQFSRNMFRNSPAMYTADWKARSLSYEIIALGYDRKLPLAYRTFAYMPLMHSERLADQDRCVELFRELAEELEGDARQSIEANAHYAVLHRDIVARFGRFPHRNEVLGRTSTDEEAEFLKQPNSGF